MSEKPKRNPSRGTTSSNSRTRDSSSRPETRSSNRAPRTLPSWIDSFEEGDDLLEAPRESAKRSLLPPPRAHPPQHQHTPAPAPRRVSLDGYVDTYVDEGAERRKPETGFFGGVREPVKGRKWDHAREGEPVIMRSSALMPDVSWRTYIKASAYGHAPREDAKQVDDEFLRVQTPGYEKPWRGDVEGGEDIDGLSSLLRNKKKRQTLARRIQHTLVMHPYVPLIFRLIVFTTSVIALGLSSSIYSLSRRHRYPQTASTVIAIIVDVVAIPYILYITWDEYTGKPLGLRSPRAKMRLVLLDLFFIVFESANLALAFQSLTDDDAACSVADNGYTGSLCHRLETLCGILMIATISWTLTFMISIFRLVERVSGREVED